MPYRMVYVVYRAEWSYATQIIMNMMFYFRDLLDRDHEFSTSDELKNSMNPHPRVIANLYNQWTAANLGARSGKGMLEVCVHAAFPSNFFNDNRVLFSEAGGKTWYISRGYYRKMELRTTFCAGDNATNATGPLSAGVVSDQFYRFLIKLRLRQ